MTRSSQTPQSAAAVKAALCEYLRTLEVGARLAPERKLAEGYQISRSTMSKVLAELEREGMVARRIGRGTFVTPRDAVAVPASIPTGQQEIVLVYPDVFSFGIWDQIHHLEIAAMRRGLRLNHLRMQPQSELDLLFRIAAQDKHVQGVVIIAGMPLRPPQLERLNSLGLPVVFIGKINGIDLYGNCRSVYSNHFVAGYQKLEILLRNGHRRIGLIHNEPPTPAWQENIRGLKEAARNFKLPWRTLVQPDTHTAFWQDSLESGYALTCEVLRKAPDLTALAVDTSPGAIGALRALHDLKLRCPDDISIVTALANARIEEYTCPALTTVVTLTEKITAVVLEVLTGKSDPVSREIRVDPVMIERESIRKLS